MNQTSERGPEGPRQNRRTTQPTSKLYHARHGRRRCGFPTTREEAQQAYRLGYITAAGLRELIEEGGLW